MTLFANGKNLKTNIKKAGLLSFLMSTLMVLSTPIHAKVADTSAAFNDYFGYFQLKPGTGKITYPLHTQSLTGNRVNVLCADYAMAGAAPGDMIFTMKAAE